MAVIRGKPPWYAVPGLPDGVPALLRARAEGAAEALRQWHAHDRTVTVVHHIDADGVSAGAIAVAALRRAGSKHRTLAAKSLDDIHLDKIRAGTPEALWFCDFGSTAYMHFPTTPRLVCDHHELVRDGTENDFPHVNPLLDDLPGDSISGAGCAYLVAAALDAANTELLPIALVGGAADLQDRNGGFRGANLALQKQGEAAGLLEVRRDLCWYGPDVRTVAKYLHMAREPDIPGLSGDRKAADALVARLEISPQTSGGTQPTWGELDAQERTTLTSAIVAQFLDIGTPPAVIDELLRDVVRITGEAPGTPMRELQSFGTLLNSTARYGRPEIGLAVAGGDRAGALDEAMQLLAGHRQHLAIAVGKMAARGITNQGSIQWVNMEADVHDTVVGIVCGMALEGLSLRRDAPLLGLAYTPDGATKVSSRAPGALQGRVDLATAMRSAAAAVGGQGGGHKGAAGATIPRGRENEFLRIVEDIVARQLGGSPQPAPGDTSAPSPGSTPMRKGQATLGEIY